MGYELVEQSGWRYPDAVLFPAGTGLIGIWKAFEEMEALGWVGGKRPRMIAVQSSGNAPMHELMLDVVRQSGGRTLDLEDGQLQASLLDWARQEGLLLSPEGAAATAAYEHLIASARLSPEEKVVVFDTGARGKYADVIAAAIQSPSGIEKDHRGVTLPSKYRVGGIITPQ